MLSDPNPYPILASLRSTSIAGIIAPPTIFTNTRAFTLLHGVDYITSGALTLSVPTFSPSVNYNITAKTPIKIIDKCRGNIILSFTDNSRPVDCLMSHTNGDIYAKVYSSSLKECIGAFQVVGGDPSRGFIGIDCVWDLEAGMGIEYCVHGSVDKLVNETLFGVGDQESHGATGSLSASGIIYKNEWMDKGVVCSVEGSSISF